MRQCVQEAYIAKLLSGAWELKQKPRPYQDTCPPLGGRGRRYVLGIASTLQVSSRSTGEQFVPAALMAEDREGEGREDESRRRLSVAEQDALAVIKADLGEWLSRILDVPLLTADGFMSALDTGVLLCQLARRIQTRARELQQEGSREGAPPPPAQVPMGRVTYFKEAKTESFYARDNASNFISWCQELGVGEAVLFESEGLVMHRDERRVVLCLLEVARRATTCPGLPTPNLIKMEIEMDQESVASSEAGDSPRHKSSKPVDPTYHHDGQEQEASNGSLKEAANKPTPPAPASKDHSPPRTPSSREGSTSSERSPPRKRARQLSEVDQDVSSPHL